MLHFFTIMKTFIPKEKDIERKWYLVDVKDKVLGRTASKIADVLRGKNKAYFSNHQDTGDFVIVTNAENVKVTGKKYNNKIYRSHSGYLGGMKEKTFKEVSKLYPERIIEKAVKGMLPKNRLGRKIFKKLKVYKGSHHPHQSQQPEELKW